MYVYNKVRADMKLNVKLATLFKVINTIANVGLVDTSKQTSHVVIYQLAQ